MREPLREDAAEGPPPNRPWGEMAVVADPDDCDEGIPDEELPDTVPDPRPWPAGEHAEDERATDDDAADDGATDDDRHGA